MANKNYDLSDVISDLTIRRIIIDSEKKTVIVPIDVYPGIQAWGRIDFLKNHNHYHVLLPEQTYAVLTRSKATDRKPRKERPRKEPRKVKVFRNDMGERVNEKGQWVNEKGETLTQELGRILTFKERSRK